MEKDSKKKHRSHSIELRKVREKRVGRPPQKKPRGNRNYGQAEMQFRIDTIMSLMVKGISRNNILKYIAQAYEKEKEEKTDNYIWDLSKSSIDKYIAKAKKEFKKLSSYKRSVEIGKVIKQYDDLYRRNEKKDDELCVKILKGKRELLGLDEPQRKIIDKKVKKIRSIKVEILPSKKPDKIAEAEEVEYVEVKELPENND